MPEPLKNLYTPELIGRLADKIRQNYSAFDKKAFINAVFDATWEGRELKQRVRHITACLHRFLPVPYAQQVDVICRTAPAISGFLGLLFPDFIEVYGLDDPDVSIPALELLTSLSSSEFAVRPYIMRYEKRMLKQHLVWAKSKDPHIRRLASEGIRPRLPWAVALPQFKKDPAPILPVLELLKADASEYVRRSVANNLNDISKDHPDVVLDVIRRWKGISKETDWIVKHASRGLLKKGHTEALSSFGLDHRVKASVNAFKLSRKKLGIGENFDMTFEVKLDDKKEKDVRVEYRIYFMKSNGSLSPKIFQVGTYAMKPGQSLSFRKQHKFADLTTRRHYKGEHRISIVINGKETGQEIFHLTAS